MRTCVVVLRYTRTGLYREVLLKITSTVLIIEHLILIIKTNEMTEAVHLFSWWQANDLEKNAFLKSGLCHRFERLTWSFKGRRTSKQPDEKREVEPIYNAFVSHRAFCWWLYIPFHDTDSQRKSQTISLYGLKQIMSRGRSYGTDKGMSTVWENGLIYGQVKQIYISRINPGYWENWLDEICASTYAAFGYDEAYDEVGVQTFKARVEWEPDEKISWYVPEAGVIKSEHVKEKAFSFSNRVNEIEELFKRTWFGKSNCIILLLKASLLPHSQKICEQKIWIPGTSKTVFDRPCCQTVMSRKQPVLLLTVLKEQFNQYEWSNNIPR